MLGLALVLGACGGEAEEAPEEEQRAIEAQLEDPENAAFDAAGNLYVSDCEGNRVLRVDRSGAMTVVAGTGEALGASGDGGPATKAGLACPTGLAFDGQGNLYFAEFLNHRVRMIATDGDITTVAGTGEGGFSGDGGPATGALLDSPSGIAFDEDGNLYIADTDNYRIRRVSPDGVISTFAGTGESGSSGDGGPARKAGLDPTYMAFDGEGNLYVTEVDNARVRKIDPDGVITTIAGTGELGSSGDGGPATKAMLDGAYGLALDQEGNLYVSQGDHDARVRKIDADGVITTVAGTGEVGFSGDGGPATKAEFSGKVFGLAVDEAGNLYVADGGNSRIRKVDPRGVITTFAGGEGGT